MQEIPVPTKPELTPVEDAPQFLENALHRLNSREMKVNVYDFFQSLVNQIEAQRMDNTGEVKPISQDQSDFYRTQFDAILRSQLLTLHANPPTRIIESGQE